jgi:transposase
MRHGVIWRKLSFGTQNERGDRFVEVILTVIETCRQQKRSVLQFVRQAIQHRKTESVLLGCTHKRLREWER